MSTYIIKNDELEPDFIDVNGFILADESLVFTGNFVNVNNGDSGYYNATPLTLKSNSVKYLLESVTFANNISEKEQEFEGEIVYTAIPRSRLV